MPRVLYWNAVVPRHFGCKLKAIQTFLRCLNIFISTQLLRWGHAMSSSRPSAIADAPEDAAAAQAPARWAATGAPAWTSAASDRSRQQSSSSSGGGGGSRLFGAALAGVQVPQQARVVTPNTGNATTDAAAQTIPTRTSKAGSALVSRTLDVFAGLDALAATCGTRTSQAGTWNSAATSLIY